MITVSGQGEVGEVEVEVVVVLLDEVSSSLVSIAEVLDAKS